jgi:hypothetical protein
MIIVITTQDGNFLHLTDQLQLVACVFWRGGSVKNFIKFIFDDQNCGRGLSFDEVTKKNCRQLQT